MLSSTRSPSGQSQTITLFLVLTLSFWIVNGDRTLAIFPQLGRIIIFKKFYYVHWCRGTSGMNIFGFDWSLDNCWIHAPFRFIGKIWRKLKEQRAKPTIIFPLWTSSTWWHLTAPDAIHLWILWLIWFGFQGLPFSFRLGATYFGWSNHLTTGLANYGLATQFLSNPTRLQALKARSLHSRRLSCLLEQHLEEDPLSGFH